MAAGVAFPLSKQYDSNHKPRWMRCKLMNGKSIIYSIGVTACLLIGLSQTAISAGIIADPVIGINDPIMGSKHDFTGLNERAGVAAMSGVAFSDYGNPCVYCHLPPEEADTSTEPLGGIDGWNRFAPPADQYTTYQSSTLDAQLRTPGSISLLCLSCHDGTMAMDMVLFKPSSFREEDDIALHMRMSSDDDLTSCGRCHNGFTAHDIAPKVLGTDLSNDHPISLQYAGLNWKDKDFKLPEQAVGFDNGVRLYNGDVECASCHDVHNSTNELLLTVRREILCETCHTK